MDEPLTAYEPLEDPERGQATEEHREYGARTSAGSGRAESGTLLTDCGEPDCWVLGQRHRHGEDADLVAEVCGGGGWPAGNGDGDQNLVELFTGP